MLTNDPESSEYLSYVVENRPQHGGVQPKYPTFQKQPYPHHQNSPQLPFYNNQYSRQAPQHKHNNSNPQPSNLVMKDDPPKKLQDPGKVMLAKYASTMKLPAPVYETSESGSFFVSTVVVSHPAEGINFLFQCFTPFKSKKEAEHNVATRAFQYLKEMDSCISKDMVKIRRAGFIGFLKSDIERKTFGGSIIPDDFRVSLTDVEESRPLHYEDGKFELSEFISCLVSNHGDFDRDSKRQRKHSSRQEQSTKPAEQSIKVVEHAIRPVKQAVRPPAQPLEDSRYKAQISSLEAFLEYKFHDKRLAIQCIVEPTEKDEILAVSKLQWIGKQFVAMIETMIIFRDNRHTDPVVIDLLAQRNLTCCVDISKIVGGWLVPIDPKRPMSNEEHNAHLHTIMGAVALDNPFFDEKDSTVPQFDFTEGQKVWNRLRSLNFSNQDSLYS